MLERILSLMSERGCFSDRLADALDAAGSPMCVGLDPVIERLPASLAPRSPGDGPEAVRQFSLGVLDAVAGVAPVVKFQSACYERFGPRGVEALHESIAHARRLGLVVILDAKRGDIGISAQHYAASAFTPPGDADALTVSGYLGPDTIEPFLVDASRGVFVLVRTSNPGSDAVQSLPLADGRSVAEMMSDHVATLGAKRLGRRGLSNVGAVVGATKSSDAAALRARMPDTIFLIPGYGAQGGTINDIRPMRRPAAKRVGDLGLLVTASRSVIYPDQTGADWRSAVRSSAERLRDELATLGA